MKKLILLRHAKSSWRNSSQIDFDRPLSKRGRHNATKIGCYIRKNQLNADLILCSPSKRAEETFNLIRAAFSKSWEAKFLDQLYLAQERDIIREIHKIQTAICNLLVIGHNPGLSSLASTLASKGKNQLGISLPNKYVTGALSIFDVDVMNWSELNVYNAELVEFLQPKDLTG